MPNTSTDNLLRTIVAASVPPPPLAPARALRLAAIRAAERSIGLPLTVLEIEEGEGGLDDLFAEFGSGLMLLVLRQDGKATGLVALDAEARAAAIEAQALGRVSDTPAEPRDPTAADAALARPFLSSFLSEVEESAGDTPLAGWLRGPELGERIPSTREATMLLADGRYRLVRLRLDLGAGGREGILLLLARLPAPAVLPEETPAPTVASQVLRAESAVEAVLHRLRLPLGEAEALTAGQVISLPGVTVTSVGLESGGVAIGLGRLGQVAGMRAVRIETPLAPSLAPIPPLREAQAPPLPLAEGPSPLAGSQGIPIAMPRPVADAVPAAQIAAAPSAADDLRATLAEAR